MTEKSLIDCHVHLAALPDGDNGCYISPKLLKSPLFRFLLWKHQLSPSNPREANLKYLDDLLTELRASRHVQKAVLLALDGGVAVIAAHACSYGLIIYEKFLPILRDLAKHYPNFYSDISALTQPNRFRMLLHLRQYPEVHERLLFGTDYPLSVLHIAAWGRVAFGTLRKMIQTKNRFDRQFEVCNGLTLSFRSLGDLLPHLTAKK